MDGGFFLGDLDALDLFELLDAGLDLLGLGGLARKRLMKASRASMPVALVLVRGHELGAALFFLGQVLS